MSNRRYSMLDLEWTKQRTSIIQISAIAVEVSKSEQPEIVGHFNRYVKPLADSLLCEETVRLTGITPQVLENAVSFADAWSTFLAWAGERRVVLCSWSDRDVRALLINLRRHKIKRRAPFIHDIQRVFMRMFCLKDQPSLTAALKFLELDFFGTPHDAFYDALNLAYLFMAKPRRMLTLLWKLMDEHRRRSQAAAVGKGGVCA